MEKYAEYDKIAEQLYQFFQQHFDTECYFAVSQAIEEVQQMPAVFQHLEQMLEEKFYQPKQHILLSGVQVGENDNSSAEDAVIVGSISEDIRYKDMTHLWQDFRKLEQKYRNDKQFSEMYVKFVFSSILKEIHEEMSGSEEREFSKTVDRLYKCRTIKDVLAITEASIRELEAHYQEKDEGFRKEVTDVKSYIFHHYAEDLSVELLAEKVYLSAGYLSVVFKEETGKNLNRFIREVRMNKAKEMLENSSKKITQIAKEVGFSNTSYFCRSFREFFGSTPESCRRGGQDDQEVQNGGVEN